MSHGMSSTERETVRNQKSSSSGSLDQVLMQNPAMSAGYHSQFGQAQVHKLSKRNGDRTTGFFHKLDYLGESELFFTFQAIDMNTATLVVMKALKVSPSRSSCKKTPRLRSGASSTRWPTS